MELPEEILAHIFSFLSLKDKCNAFLVCKTWSNSLTCSSAWTHAEIMCDSRDCVPQRFSDRLPCIRHLKLIVSVDEPAHRQTGLWVLQQVLTRGHGRLRRLCISCLGNPPLFYAGQDLLQGLVDVLSNGSSLMVLDLRGVPFTLNDDCIKCIAALCPALQSLFINNSSLVCGVVSETVRYVLKRCPSLNTIGLFQASISHDVLRDLLEPQRTKLMLLELRCERSLKYVTPLSDQIWADVKRRHPSLRVDLELDHTLPELQVPSVLQPSIPVRQLRLHTWTCLLDELRLVAQSYAGTLEVLELQTTASSELNTVLVSIATQCTKLCEVHCYCVVSQNVIEAFCSLCPDLHRYTLKTRKELHPWTCTTLR
ncbi:F-box/LRR-repeat protein 8 isoform X2 [Tachysurus fulvidraco]|uniref:F-box/LRR-repeat protein 8 isoform X2 n=1 Tax=Tachysurus fulvidraco TaxID=1234273 RepID=UPI000F4E5F3A|nr:F-box/LRR-repeat protein 8 isoform X2 [Tachysurus fulvidraco]